MEQTNTPDLPEKIIPKAPGNPPLCEKHGVEKQAVNFGLYGTTPAWRWFCLKCGEEKSDRERQEEAKREAFKRQERINKNLENAMIAPRFKSKTFENFQVETDKQSHAMKQAREFLEHFGESTGMVFTGKPGTGKNHLASAITREFVTTKGKTALITTAMKIVRAIKDSWSGGKESEVIRRFIDPDLLVIDEMGVQFGSDTERLYLTEIINDRYEWLKPTIILTNLTMSELAKALGERVIDRFREGGHVLIFDWKSYRGRKD